MDPEAPERIYERIEADGLPALAAREGEKVTLRHSGERAATVRGVEARRLTGLTMAMAEAGELALESEQWNELREAQRRAMFLALGAERMLFRASEAFAEAGIDAVVLKGPSMAHTIYPDPSWRPFGDIDLLVRTRDWPRAWALLPERGVWAGRALGCDRGVRSRAEERGEDAVLCPPRGSRLGGRSERAAKGAPGASRLHHESSPRRDRGRQPAGDPRSQEEDCIRL